jgi:glycosyltransferase involved in cell wall biosynthesis
VKTVFNHRSPDPELKVCVVLPVKDEADNIFSTLEALRQQFDLNNQRLAYNVYEILLLANNCLDNTAQIACEYAKRHPGFALHVTSVELTSDLAHVGFARKMVMDEASRRFSLLHNSSGIIASTDGDTIADSKWIAHIIYEIEQGAEAVGGKIDTVSTEIACGDYYLADEKYRTLLAQLESILDPALHDPWPRHFQYFGANLAIKSSVYEAVGGLPAKRFLEDSALHEALFRKDIKIRKSPYVLVQTSPRLAGRVEIGFSEQLRTWAQMKEERRLQFVPSASEMITLFYIRKELRRLWENRYQGISEEAVQRIASEFHLTATWLGSAVLHSCHFGELWLSIEEHRKTGNWPERFPQEDIFVTISRLEDFIAAN